MTKLFTIFFLFAASLCFAQEMRIGLIRSVKSKSIEFSFNKGAYHVYGDTSFVGTIQIGEKANVQLSGSKLTVALNGLSSGSFERILFAQDSSNSSFKLASITPSSKQHLYADNLELTVETGRIRIVNVVDMNNYLAGVIESEGGGGQHLEYYKVQALMSRTYAFQNKARHKKEGFELCDDVHCQAYHNMLKHTPKIKQAVEETDGEVIVDQKGTMLTTYFSANCGGETCDASHVWNNSVSYCAPFVDTFCIHTRQATWTKTIEKSQWLSFLRKEYGFDVNNEKLLALAFDFRQDQRKAFYIHPSLGIPLRDLRTEFKLKSTFFDVTIEGAQVKLHGRGFGHGVGLCQEGAMKMANSGYSYKQIATYYFTNVRVVNHEKVQFFQQSTSGF